MTFDSVIKYLTFDQQTSLNLLVSEGYLTKNQAIEILQKAIKLKKTDEQFGVRKAVNTLLYVFSFLKKIGVREGDHKIYSNTVERLRKENGDETVNEILSHTALWSIFPLYRVAPLFENLPDGFIVDGTTEIPVEIKSRFPEIFSTIYAFAEGFAKLSYESKNLDIAFHIHIVNIIKFDKAACLKEIKFNEQAFENIIIDQGKPFPHFLHVERKTNEIEYAVKIMLSETPKDRTIIGFLNTDQLAEASYISWVFARAVADICPITKRNFTGPSQTLYLTLSDNTKEYLAKTTVKRGINNITNLPPEPRIIVFFSTTFNEFASKFCEKYTNDRKGSMVIGIEPSPNSFEEENGFSFRISVITAGENIKDTAKKYVSNPDLLR